MNPEKINKVCDQIINLALNSNDHLDIYEDMIITLSNPKYILIFAKLVDGVNLTNIENALIRLKAKKELEQLRELIYTPKHILALKKRGE